MKSNETNQTQLTKQAPQLAQLSEEELASINGGFTRRDVFGVNTPRTRIGWTANARGRRRR